MESNKIYYVNGTLYDGKDCGEIDTVGPFSKEEIDELVNHLKGNGYQLTEKDDYDDDYYDDDDYEEDDDNYEENDDDYEEDDDEYSDVSYHLWLPQPDWDHHGDYCRSVHIFKKKIKNITINELITSIPTLENW